MLILETVIKSNRKTEDHQGYTKGKYVSKLLVFEDTQFHEVSLFASWLFWKYCDQDPFNASLFDLLGKLYS